MRQDLPVIVCVVERIACDLLSLTGDSPIVISERIVLSMAVKVGLGVLVSQRYAIVVLDFNCSCVHRVVGQSFLELGRHEVVAWARFGENGKVYLEPEQIEEEWHNNQTDQSCPKVFSKCDQIQCASFSVDIEQIPQIDADSAANGNEDEETNIFRGHDTAHVETSQQQPLPPLATKGLMSLLVELDVAQQAQCHEEDEGRVEEDKSSLTNVRVIEQDEAGRKNAGWQRVARLPHDEEYNGNSQRTQQSRESPISHVWYIVLDVRVPNVVEKKLSVVANKPADQSKQEFGEGRVDIEEVEPLEVVGSELRSSQQKNFDMPKCSYVRTLPKCTSSKTTSSGWLMP